VDGEDVIYQVCKYWVPHFWLTGKVVWWGPSSCNYGRDCMWAV